MKSSDTLLREFAAVRRIRDRLRRERRSYHCQEAEQYPPEGKACWKQWCYDDEMGESYQDMSSWCDNCRAREKAHRLLRVVMRRHGGALRGLLRRGAGLLGEHERIMAEHDREEAAR